jgi:hypothetical protein
MSVAIICPIGTLASQGYQHVYKPCIQSHVDFADGAYYVQSIDDARNIDFVTDKAVLISNKSTWFDVGVYSGQRINDNLQLATDTAFSDGFDCVVLMHSNAYIPQFTHDRLRRKIETGAAFLNRVTQLSDRAIGQCKKMPVIIHKHDRAFSSFSFLPDGMMVSKDLVTPFYDVANDIDFIDVPLELTRDELEERSNIRRCYAEYTGGVDRFDFQQWKSKTLGKLAHPRPLFLCDYGYEIASISHGRPDFLSHEILREAQP